MIVAEPAVDRKIGRLLDLLPDVLRADRPASATLGELTEVARELLGASYACLTLLRDDGSFGPTAYAGVPDDHVRHSATWLAGADLFGQLVRAPGVLRVDRVPAQRGDASAGVGVEGFLGVHLRSGHRTLGLLYVCNPVEAASFSADTEALAASLGATLGAALGNAGLLRDALRNRRWMRASTMLTRELFGQDENESLRRISDLARELADADLVMMLTVEDDSARVRYARGLGSEDRVGQTYLMAGTWTGRVVSTGRPEVVADLASAETTGPESINGIELGPAMLLPLKGAHEVLGALFLCRHRDAERFTQADLETAGSFADHAAVTLELSAARETTEKLRRLEDRNAIARDLHDHVIQRLYATGMTLQLALKSVEDPVRSRIELSVSTIDDTIRQIRNTIMTLRAEDEIGSATLDALVTSIAREASPLLGFTPLVALEAPSGEVSGPLAADLAACIREGISNIIRHARAETVEITGHVEDAVLHLSLSDDGVGIQSTRRSGLRNLAQRVEMHGGTFAAESPPTGGTLLQWQVPLSRPGR